MKKIEYVREKIENIQKIHLTSHAKRRAALRGIKTEKIEESLENGNILGVKYNENPNLSSYDKIIQIRAFLPSNIL